MSAGHPSLSVTARGVDCAGVLPPARPPFCRATGSGVGSSTRVPTAGAQRLPGLLLPCQPSGPGGVDVAPTRIRCAGYPCPALCQVPPVSQELLPFSFFLSCARRPVQACPGLGPAGPAACRPLTAQRPGLRRDMTSPPCVQPGPPAQEPIC